MQYQILDKPEFSVIQVQFDQAGEAMLCEPDAMVAKDTAVEMKTEMKGGLLGAAKRRLLGGESIFQNTFTATAPGQSLWLAPGPEGDTELLEMDGTQSVFLQSGAYLASSPQVTLDTKWGGAKGFFSGTGLFLLKCTGVGPLLWSSRAAAAGSPSQLSMPSVTNTTARSPWKSPKSAAICWSE